MTIATQDPMTLLEDRQALEAFVVENSDLETLEGFLEQFNIFEAVGVVRQELRHSDFLAALPNPCIDRAKHHTLLDIVTIAPCAVDCGADSWLEVERFGRAKRSWLQMFLALPNGIPSYDTLLRREVTAKVGVKAKQLMCGWDVTYLATVLTASCGCPGAQPRCM